VRPLLYRLRGHVASSIRNEKDGQRHFEVIDEECVGCNLCVNVCPVVNCITLKELAVGLSIHGRVEQSRVTEAGQPIPTIHAVCGPGQAVTSR